MASSNAAGLRCMYIWVVVRSLCPASLRLGHVAPPLRPSDHHVGRTPFEIDVIPIQRHDLAAPQARLAAQQDDEMGIPVDRRRGLDEPLVLVEVVEPHLRSGDLQQPDPARHLRDEMGLPTRLDLKRTRDR